MKLSGLGAPTDIFLVDTVCGICRTNVGNISSPGNNGFTIFVPPGVTIFDPNNPVPGLNSPPGVCRRACMLQSG